MKARYGLILAIVLCLIPIIAILMSIGCTKPASAANELRETGGGGDFTKSQFENFSTNNDTRQDAQDTAISGKVSKATDTMTGKLTISNNIADWFDAAEFTNNLGGLYFYLNCASTAGYRALFGFKKGGTIQEYLGWDSRFDKVYMYNVNNNGPVWWFAKYAGGDGVLSRVGYGNVNVAMRRPIFDIMSGTTAVKIYGDLDMNSSDIISVGDVDSVDVSAFKTSFDNYTASAGSGSGDFMADGSVPATGDFDMGGNAINNVDSIEDLFGNATGFYLCNYTSLQEIINLIPANSNASGTDSINIWGCTGTYDGTTIITNKMFTGNKRISIYGNWSTVVTSTSTSAPSNYFGAYSTATGWIFDSTLRDSTRSWTPNEYAGSWVVAGGDRRPILGNSTTSLYAVGLWDNFTGIQPYTIEQQTTVLTTSGSQNYTVQLINQANVTLSGLNITNGNLSALDMTGAGNIRIEYCTIDAETANVTYGLTASGFSSGTIEGCYLPDGAYTLWLDNSAFDIFRTYMDSHNNTYGAGLVLGSYAALSTSGASSIQECYVDGGEFGILAGGPQYVQFFNSNRIENFDHSGVYLFNGGRVRAGISLAVREGTRAGTYGVYVQDGCFDMALTGGAPIASGRALFEGFGTAAGFALKGGKIGGTPVAYARDCASGFTADGATFGQVSTGNFY